MKKLSLLLVLFLACLRGISAAEYLPYIKQIKMYSEGCTQTLSYTYDAYTCLISLEFEKDSSKDKQHLILKQTLGEPVGMELLDLLHPEKIYDCEYIPNHTAIKEITWYIEGKRGDYNNYRTRVTTYGFPDTYMLYLYEVYTLICSVTNGELDPTYETIPTDDWVYPSNGEGLITTPVHSEYLKGDRTILNANRAYKYDSNPIEGNGNICLLMCLIHPNIEYSDLPLFTSWARADSVMMPTAYYDTVTGETLASYRYDVDKGGRITSIYQDNAKIVEISYVPDDDPTFFFNWDVEEEIE